MLDVVKMPSEVTVTDTVPEVEEKVPDTTGFEVLMVAPETMKKSPKMSIDVSAKWRVAEVNPSLGAVRDWATGERQYFVVVRSTRKKDEFK